MRVLVLCDEPASAAGRPDTVAAIAVDLGCRVTCERLDLADLSSHKSVDPLPNILVVDPGGDRLAARACLTKLHESRFLHGIPSLLIVPVELLPGLDVTLGFDDFMLAPVLPAELYARLRQLDWRTAAFDSDELIKVGDLVIDMAGHEARLHGRRLEFTHQEFALLAHLARKRGRVFTREQLLLSVWNYDYAGGTRTVDIHVRRVRAKLGATAGGLIETVRNVGYKMRSTRADDDS